MRQSRRMRLGGGDDHLRASGSAVQQQRRICRNEEEGEGVRSSVSCSRRGEWKKKGGRYQISSKKFPFKFYQTLEIGYLLGVRLHPHACFGFLPAYYSKIYSSEEKIFCSVNLLGLSLPKLMHKIDR